MRSSRVVRASGCPCNSPGFDSSNASFDTEKSERAAEEAVLNNVHKKKKTFKNYTPSCFCNVQQLFQSGYMNVVNLLKTFLKIKGTVSFEKNVQICAE
jgi:hypothetical protein